MASQTGTLKFRQSDGTYTELYPKTTIAQVDGLQTQLNGINTSLQNKAALNSPTFTGTPKAPTASAGTNTTQIATTAYVYAAINGAIAASY